MDSFLNDFRSFSTAMTLLKSGARPTTVRLWTGFTRKRTRVVVRIYNENRAPEDPRCEHGPPPQTMRRLMKDPQLRVEITAAAALCRVLGTLPQLPLKTAAAEPIRSVVMAEKICHAFQVYKDRVPNGRLTLEHMLLVVASLASGDKWALGPCLRCDGFVLVDPMSLDARVCPECRGGSSPEAIPEVSSIEGLPPGPSGLRESGFQHSLFE